MCKLIIFLNFLQKTMVIYFIMQQKNDWPQNHQPGEAECTVSTLKCLKTKFIHALNTSLHHLPSNPHQNHQGAIEVHPNRPTFQPTKDDLSTISILNDQDILFLEDFQSQQSKTSSLRLANNHQQLVYTESQIISNDQTSLCNQESIFEQIHHHPRTKNTPPTILKNQSEVKFGNGGMFRGYMKDGKMAQGTFILDSMFCYRGGIFNDKFHGQGTVTFQNGHSVTCNWYQGRPIGHVTINYPRGQRYLGELVDFKKHGIGCLYFQDGSRYFGQFHHGEITGQGCYYSANSQEKRGLWKNGQFLGHIATKENLQLARQAAIGPGKRFQEQQRIAPRIK